VGKVIPWEVRSAVYELLVRGVSAQDIEPALGVGKSTVKTWAKLAGMKFNAPRGGGGVRVMPMTAAPTSNPQRAYRRLTLADRSFIQVARSLSEPMGVRAIARKLRVSESTVSREISGHRVEHWGQGHYDAELAHYQALASRPRRREGKLAEPELRAAVVSRLNDKYSPQQVAGELKLTFPDRVEMHVSHETIYQALYVQGKTALRHELTVVKALRSGRTARLPQSKLPARSNRPWLDGARLSERPAEVEDRAVPGHWEGDLVVGPDNSGIVTLVERQTRFALLGRLPGMRDSTTVMDVLSSMIVDLPQSLKQTITWDQGTEMATHASFTIATGCPVFFCDPHSPWQRGSNENTNGLVRDFYPKGTNFNEISDADLAETQRLLNIRPRRIHGYRKPSDMLDQLISGVALET
jgi:IS30 family transposase